MRNLAFVSWLLGWAWLMCAYPPKHDVFENTAINFLVWIVVGVATYERRKLPS